MESRKIYISQKDNYAGVFGLVYRSSAIFYFKQTDTFTTTISFMNYWSVKRSLDIMIVASVRKMDGTLVKREELFFKNGAVINYSPFRKEGFFEGTVEIEIFSSKNMVIPYSAMMVVYESSNSISMTHSYARTYSPHEVEEGRTITTGEEGCWTIRDNYSISSFAVIHNGLDIQEKQVSILEVTNYKNEKQIVKFDIPTLSPFASFKIIPCNYFSSLKDFLDGRPGNASLSFNLNKSFTRMLVGNETVDGTEFQITHSNFNYSKHETDNAGEGFAYMLIPQSKFKELKIVVYPETTKGNYKLETEDGAVYEFKSGERLELNVVPGMLKFSKLDGQLPSRIVTGLTAKVENNSSVLPFECSLGVIHKLRPLKSTFWGLIATGKKYKSRIIIYPMENIYGEITDNELEISLYTQDKLIAEKKLISNQEIEKFNKGVYLTDIFPDLNNIETDQYAYYYIKSSKYGGMFCYSTIETEMGSVSLEHSF